MPINFPPFPTGTLIFEFKGGPRDGQAEIASGPAAPGERNFAHAFWMLTDGAIVGKCFGGVSPGYWEDFKQNAIEVKPGVFKGVGPAQFHKYQIVAREDLGDGDVYVQCQYIGVGKNAVGPPPA